MSKSVLFARPPGPLRTLGVVVRTCPVLLWLVVLLLSIPEATGAVTRGLELSDYSHKVWSKNDGAPSDVWAIAQTSDGWMWFGGSNGLTRFDGIQFEHVVTEPGSTPRSGAISALFALPSGELLIGYQTGGVSLLKNRQLTHYRDASQFGAATVNSFAQGADGALWAATRTELRRFDGQRWQAVGPVAGFPEGGAINVFLDREQTLWAWSSADGIYSMARGETHFSRLGLNVGIEGEFIQASDGRSYFSDQSGVGLLPGQERGGLRDPLTNTRASYVTLFDDHDNFWSLFDELPSPTHPPERRVHGLGAIPDLKTIMQDLEGNIWLSTDTSVHRLHYQDIARVSLPGSPSAPRPVGFAVAGDGTVWMGGYSSGVEESPGDGTWRLGDERVTARVPDIEATKAIARARDGSVWVADRHRLWRYDGERFKATLNLPEVALGQLIRGLAVSAQGDLWLSVADVGLFRYRDRTWQQNGASLELPTAAPSVMATDDQGRVWLGYQDGTVRVLDGDKLMTFTQASGLRVGAVTAIGLGAQTLVCGENGVAVLSDSRFVILRATDPTAFERAGGLAELSNGDIWINSARGAVRIARGTLATALAQNQQEPELSVEVLDDEDGYPGEGALGASFNRPMAVEPSGGIWLSGVSGLAWFDPAHIQSRAPSPPVVIRGLVSEGRHIESPNHLELSKGTRDVEIDYTALTYLRPERITFRYRLDGIEEGWIDAGTRRAAYFNSLGPGTYRFSVIATDSYGSSSALSEPFEFVIPPTFTQTRTFFALAIGLALAALFLFYQLRVQQLTSAARRLVEERLAERERIARELHDTLLQGTQALALRVQAATNGLPPGDLARTTLEEALAQADAVMSEARDRIQDLRSASAAPNDLLDALSLLGQELARAHRIEFKAVVEGTVRALKPKVGEEAFRIAREALLNAFRHSSAQTVEAQIIYATDHFHLRIRDDGSGIDQEKLVSGALAGHWGLQGMRERAQVVGAQLDVWSRPGAGTEIELTVPAALAYPRRSRFAAWGLAGGGRPLAIF